MDSDDSLPSPQPGSSLDRTRLVGFLPGFSRPPSQRLDLDDDGAATTVEDPPEPVMDHLGHPLRFGPDDRRSEPADTRTGTSDTGDPPAQASPKEVGQLVAALLAALGVAAGFAVRWRYRGQYRLRQPTKAHTEAVGAPLGRIAARHVPLGKLTPDLADLVTAAVGVNTYLDAGPLRLTAGPDPGIPHDLNQEPS